MERIDDPAIATRMDKFRVATKRLGRIPNFVSNQDIRDYYRSTSMQGWFETVTEVINKEVLEQRDKLKNEIKKQRRSDFAFDEKTIWDRMLREPMERCNVEGEKLKGYWGGR
jgi:hypothetical protein